MKEKRIVTIGGGTGSFTLLSGLKNYPVKISAIVSMADDGGSTGVLRDELGVLPPGDVRQCLVALSDSSQTLRELLNYRFEKGGLKGHNFGNLLLSALEKISGNFSKGVNEAIKILNVKGEVIPVSDRDMRLNLQLNNGKILVGEKELDHNKEIRSVGINKIFLKPAVRANKQALKRIREADAIIIGPGDLYGSIVPNLLVGGICRAIRQSKAKVIYNCNLTNKKGQTDGFNLSDYVSSINEYLGKNRIDYVTFNTKEPNPVLTKRYEKHEGINMIVSHDIRDSKKRNYRVISSDLLKKEKLKKTRGDANSSSRSFIRHDSNKLAKVLMMILELGEYENIIKEII